jgi:hypothetical protein
MGCRGNVPSEPLPSNGCPSIVDSVTSGTCLLNRCLTMDVSAVILWLHNSGIQASWHNIFSRLLPVLKWGLLYGEFQSQSHCELLYDWRFTANQFILESSLLRLTTSDFLFCNWTLVVRPCVTSSLKRGWVCVLWMYLAFVKCKYRTYSTWLKTLPFSLCKTPMSVQALQSRACVSYLTYATAAALSLERS